MGGSESSCSEPVPSSSGSDAGPLRSAADAGTKLAVDPAPPCIDDDTCLPSPEPMPNTTISVEQGGQHGPIGPIQPDPLEQDPSEDDPAFEITLPKLQTAQAFLDALRTSRSEERRVGKECA